MAIDERSRHELYLRLEEVLGEHEATALMEYLPPTGWADVARRQDVEAAIAGLGREVRLEIAASADRVTATVRAEMNEQLRTMVLAMVGTNVTLAALAFGAANLI